MGVIGWQKLFIGHFMTPLLVLKEIIQFPYNRKGPAFLILLLPASRSRIGTPFLSISICNKPAVCSTSLNYVLIQAQNQPGELSHLCGTWFGSQTFLLFFSNPQCQPVIIYKPQFIKTTYGCPIVVSGIPVPQVLICRITIIQIKRMFRENSKSIWQLLQ